MTGTSFEQQLMLRTASSVRPLTANGTDSAALSRLGGAEVVVWGMTVGGPFAVTQFMIRSVEGANVFDGVLVRDGSRLFLRTRAGKLALGNPPLAFDSLVGARLWVNGPLDKGPNVYGVIAPPER